MIDGAAFKEEVESKNTMAVPTVFLNGESFGNGRVSLEEIVVKIGNVPDASEFADKGAVQHIELSGVSTR